MSTERVINEPEREKKQQVKFIYLSRQKILPELPTLVDQSVAFMCLYHRVMREKFKGVNGGKSQ